MQKYLRPSFLPEHITREQYIRWLERKAIAHRDRDRNRGNSTATITEYKEAIHKAVLSSEGRDNYTGEKLDWTLISTYDNESSKAGGREYKKQFCLLPSVDHIGDGLGPANFTICALRTNSAKSDMDLIEFIELCKAVVEHYGYVVSPPPILETEQ